MKIYQSRPQNNVHFVISNGIKGTIQCCFYNSNLSFDHFVSLSFSYPFLHTLPLSDHTTTKSLPPPTTCNVDDSSAISVNGYEDRLAIAANATGGQKAILAISEDNESAVIKYRSDQDMSSIGEYQDFLHHWLFWRENSNSLIGQSYQMNKTSQSGSSEISSFLSLLLHVCFCSRVFIYYVFAGPSKSLTFEEGLVGNGEAGAGTDNEAPKKVPDPCCPIVCERM